MTTARFCHWCGNPDAKERIRGIAGLREYCETCEIPTSGPSAGPVGDLPDEAVEAAQRVVYAERPGDLGMANLVVRALAAALPLIRAHIADEARAHALREAANEIHREARWQKESQTRGMFANGETSVDRLLMLERIMRLAATGTPWTMLQHTDIVFGADETDPSEPNPDSHEWLGHDR